MPPVFEMGGLGVPSRSISSSKANLKHDRPVLKPYNMLKLKHVTVTEFREWKGAIEAFLWCKVCTIPRELPIRKSGECSKTCTLDYQLSGSVYIVFSYLRDYIRSL